MAMKAAEPCGPCGRGKHAHASQDECGRRMYDRYFFCGCDEPLTGHRCSECENTTGPWKADFGVDRFGSFHHNRPQCQRNSR